MEIEKTIETPLQKMKVVIKTILTGGEREQVNTAEMAFVDTSIDTKDEGKVAVKDMQKLTLAKKHKLIQLSIVSINDDRSNVLERWLKMYDVDCDYVYNQIVEEQKKIQASTQEGSS